MTTTAPAHPAIGSSSFSRLSGIPIVLVAFSALALSACSDGGERHPAPTTDAERAVASDELVATAVPSGDGPGCSAAVARRGEVLWSGAAGLARVSTGDPLTSDTVFDIASTSKHITGMATLVLVDDGMVNLDAPVATYLPDAGPWASSTTVDQLLHHTSGLPDYIGLLMDEGVVIADSVSQAEAMATLAEVPAVDTPVPWAYSNSNYLVLASIVEAVSGQSFPDFARDRLFAPMGSSLVADPLAVYPDIAARYRSFGAVDEELEVGWEVYGDGAVLASSIELALWFDVFRTGLPGYPTIGEDMVADPAVVSEDDGTGYGAGVFVAPTGMLWHSGGWEGQVSYAAISEDRSTTVAVICNAENASVALSEIGVGLLSFWFPVVDQYDPEA